MTRINPNDPKWTAYVLGELDKADSEAVERLLKSSPEARALVDELKAASAVLREAFDDTPEDLLTAAQRASVRQAADAGAPRWFAMMPMRWAVGALSVAVITIAVTVAVGMRTPQPMSRAATRVTEMRESTEAIQAGPIASVPSAVPPSAATTPPQDRIVRAPVDP